MTCRWLRGREASLGPVTGEAMTAYLELARASREADFRWLALSQGVPPGEVEALWRRVRRALGLPS